MRTVIYKKLNHHAKTWWYHMELRENGKHIEARTKERFSIKSSLATIRRAVLMTIGHGGWTVHYEDANTRVSGCRLEGYGEGEPYASILKGLGVPVVDMRQIPHEKLIDLVISGPSFITGVTPDAPPYNGFSHCPLDHYVGLYVDAGAQVWNDPRQVNQAA